MISNSEYFSLVERQKAVFAEIQILQEELKPLLTQLDSLKVEWVEVMFKLNTVKKERKELELFETAGAFFTWSGNMLFEEEEEDERFKQYEIDAAKAEAIFWEAEEQTEQKEQKEE